MPDYTQDTLFSIEEPAPLAVAPAPPPVPLGAVVHVYAYDAPCVQEPRRAGSNGHSTKYSMDVCPSPTCRRYCAQERGDWTREAGAWIENLTCTACGRRYARVLLPYEIAAAQAGRRHA